MRCFYQMLNFRKNFGNYFCVKSFLHTFASQFKAYTSFKEDKNERPNFN